VGFRGGEHAEQKAFGGTEDLPEVHGGEVGGYPGSGGGA
jgi:hypothetical protein